MVCQMARKIMSLGEDWTTQRWIHEEHAQYVVLHGGCSKLWYPLVPQKCPYAALSRPSRIGTGNMSYLYNLIYTYSYISTGVSATVMMFILACTNPKIFISVVGICWGFRWSRKPAGNEGMWLNARLEATKYSRTSRFIPSWACEFPSEDVCQHVMIAAPGDWLQGWFGESTSQDEHEHRASCLNVLT